MRISSYQRCPRNPAEQGYGSLGILFISFFRDYSLNPAELDMEPSKKNLITLKLSIFWPRPGLLFSSGRHKPVHGGFAAAVRAAETREKSSPDLELRIRGNQKKKQENNL